MQYSGNTWQDHYAKRARKERFPARSVYKLKELQQKFSLIKRGQRVLDLGCAPGAWLLYAAQICGQQGRVVGIDLKPVTIDLPPNAQAYEADIIDLPPEILDNMGHHFDILLSDMAPATTGSKRLNADKSAALCEAALGLSQELLVPGGHFVCKIFQGRDFQSFLKQLQHGFAKVKIFKPISSRKQSREIYLIGLQKK